MQKRSKKGFTLAELLIVVAIIAVLVAIAVPIFVGALTKAEKATLEANERTLKGMVVAEILSDDTLLYYNDDADDNKQKPCTEWYAMGTYDASTDKWEIKKENIVSKESKSEKITELSGKKSSKSGNKYTLYVTVYYTDITV